MTDGGGKGPSEKKKEKKKKRKLITDHTCFIPCVVEVIKYPLKEKRMKRISNKVVRYI